MITKDIGDI